ncbi:MAG: hypothetical protein A3G41_01095 [Elusimicrobia bacterium RIFCSPLOWO2_12_FULL_59_9]|nr:MAG: hypothetical protein A3G41_01095 [Elusimicrobia bacterium RIFCSPLOWO2_12_FULL_59_9]
MTVAKTLFPVKAFPGLKSVSNPSPAELRRRAAFEERTTSFRAPAYYTRRASSRSAQNTFLLEGETKAGRHQAAMAPEFARRVAEWVAQAMPKVEWYRIDRVIGRHPSASFHARLWLPQEYARVALLWSQTLFAPSQAQKNLSREPDVLTVYLPQWKELIPEAARSGLPERLVLLCPDRGVNYVLGIDYVGEAKMSFLRLAMFGMKRRGGLGLHAGSKLIRAASGAELRDVGMLLFGLSGTGKTTLTLDDHGLKKPEGVLTLQDDIVFLTRDGAAYGSEDNFYVKTEGLAREEQPDLYAALTNENSVFENVHVDEAGAVDFLNYANGTNGRALCRRNLLPNASDQIDLGRVDKVVFITRRDTVVPPVARLSRDQAAAYFMLGESIETSAGDPSKAGQSIRQVGFNPFIVGLEEDEGNRFWEILRDNPGIEVYLLNTGSIGKGADNGGAGAAGVKITKAVSSAILVFIARQGKLEPGAWMADAEWGYETPARVPGIDDFARKYSPRSYYRAPTYRRLVQDLKQERQAYLSQFTRLRPEASRAL